MSSDRAIDNEFIELKIIKDSIWLMTFKFKTWTLESVTATSKALNFLESQTGELGLITTCSNPSIYSAGIDFTQFGKSLTYSTTFLMHFQRLLAQFMRLSFPSIAAINGHCFAGGIMIAMAQDFRIQRDDHGHICLSEINIGMPIPWGMLFHIQDKVSHQTIRKLALFGHKFTPQESLESSLVDKLVPKDKLIDECVAFLEPMVEKSHSRGAFAQIRDAIHKRGIEASLEKFLPPLSLMPDPEAKQKL